MPCDPTTKAILCLSKGFSFFFFFFLAKATSPRSVMHSFNTSLFNVYSVTSPGSTKLNV